MKSKNWRLVIHNRFYFGDTAYFSKRFNIEIKKIWRRLKKYEKGLISAEEVVE